MMLKKMAVKTACRWRPRSIFGKPQKRRREGTGGGLLEAGGNDDGGVGRGEANVSARNEFFMKKTKYCFSLMR